MTAIDNNGQAVSCNWYDIQGNALKSNSSSFTVESSASMPYGVYTFIAKYVADESISSVCAVHIYPAEYIITPISVSVEAGDSFTFSTIDGENNLVRSIWYLDGELLPMGNNDTSYTISFPFVGNYTVSAECWSNQNLVVTSNVVVVDDDTTEPEPSPEPSPDPSDDWVTIPDMNTSQSNQTSEIKSHIDIKSNLLMAAIESLESSLSNSSIYDLFTQSFIYYDFDFQTGDLAVSGDTYNGFVPTFNHWAQNVERYLGMLVDVRASEDEEEVKNNTGGFWTLLNGLFKPSEGQTQAAANTDDMSTILGIGDDVQSYFNAGGNIGDIATVMNDESTWSWFGDDVSNDIDSVPSTYSRERIVDYRGIVYNDFYNNVLGREWGD